MQKQKANNLDLITTLRKEMYEDNYDYSYEYAHEYETKDSFDDTNGQKWGFINVIITRFLINQRHIFAQLDQFVEM